MKMLENIVKGGGAITLKFSNSNNSDQSSWPMIFRAQIYCVYEKL